MTTVQPDLFSQPRARNTDPATSHAAARRVRRIAETYDRIMAILRENPAGLTDEQIAAAWAAAGYPPISPSGLRSRRKELCEAGEVEAAPYTGYTVAGNPSKIWVAA